MKKILFASSNLSKIEQFQFIANLYHIDVEIVSVYSKYPNILPYSEDYNTQYEIVDCGAREVYEQINEPVVVEDTILEVDSLEGQPGLLANEYLREHGRSGLLEELKDEKDRGASITSIIGYFDGKQLVTVKNCLKGQIARVETYKKGEPSWVGPTFTEFGGGFSSIFIPDGLEASLADLDKAEYAKRGYRDPNFYKILQILVNSL